MSAGEVVKKDGDRKFDTGGHYVEATCPHSAIGGCGGCYARLYLVLLEIQRSPASALAAISRVFGEMKADKR